jgi:hypothetical protein
MAHSGVRAWPPGDLLTVSTNADTIRYIVTPAADHYPQESVGYERLLIKGTRSGTRARPQSAAVRGPRRSDIWALTLGESSGYAACGDDRDKCDGSLSSRSHWAVTAPDGADAA